MSGAILTWKVEKLRDRVNRGDLSKGFHISVSYFS